MKLKLAILLFVVLAYGAAPATAQQILGSAQSFAVVGSTTVTNTGATMISGNLGVSLGTAVTGFPPGTMASGTIYTGANAVVVQAKAGDQKVYDALAAKTCTTNLSGTDLGGLTLTPGVYCFDVAATLTALNAILTLDAQNGPGVFVFQIGTTLTTGTNSAVNVINGNAATGVFWQLGSSATLGIGTQFAGNIIANTSITVVSTAKILCGRAVALNGAVTMDTNAISDNCTSNNFGTGRTDFGSLGFAGAHAATHDFNGDGKSDMVWRYGPTGADYMNLMNGATVTTSAGIGGDTNWTIVGTGDFNGDGKADILWRNASSGAVFMWLMNGTSVTTSGGIGGDTNWTIAGTGDFNGDGMSDILWRHSSGLVFVSLMNGTSVTTSAPLGGDTNWTIAGTGDFNGDGNSDILWRHISGAVFMNLMNGTSVTTSAALGGDTNWTIAETGDFNADGKLDILWRYGPTGAVYMNLMNGSSVTTSALLGGDTNWTIAGTGDFNGDGKSDILWRYGPTGAVFMNLMNGATVTTSAAMGGDLNWTVIR